MQHFDNFYGKVYDMNWKSARLGLMCQNKYAAIVNNFGDNEETESMLTGLGAIELSNYYRRHHKKHLRYKLRMKIVKEKKEKKRAMMAQEQNVDPGSINLDDVVVSDVSDDEIRRQANEANLTGLSGSEAEDIVEMFQTDIENQSNNRQFINPANTRLNLNDFIPATELIFHEEIVTDKPYFEFYQADSPLENVDIIKEDIIEFPETLRVYTYPRRNLSDFPHPTVSKGIKIDSATMPLTFYLRIKRIQLLCHGRWKRVACPGSRNQASGHCWRFLRRSWWKVHADVANFTAIKVSSE